MTNRRNSMTADFRGHTADLLWVCENRRLSVNDAVFMFGRFATSPELCLVEAHRAGVAARRRARR
jgi:hypothetical protein